MLSRKREREKRQRRQNMSLVHTLLIKVKREVYILKKDVHIRARNRVEWSCLELQLVLFVLFRFAVHRQKILIMCGMILHNVLTKTFKKWDIQWSIEEKTWIYIQMIQLPVCFMYSNVRWVMKNILTTMSIIGCFVLKIRIRIIFQSHHVSVNAVYTQYSG